MGKKFCPSVEFQAEEFVNNSKVITTEISLIDAIREKYPAYADNFAERFLLATKQELSWHNIHLPNLHRFMQYLSACGLSPNSVGQYGSKLKSVLNLYRSVHPQIPSQDEISSVLAVKKDESYDTFLDDDDLDLLYCHLNNLKNGNIQVGRWNLESTRQRHIMVLQHFLIGADTGARSSDERGLTWDNIQESIDSEGNSIYVLTYTSKKRGIKASVPLAKNSRVIPLIKENIPLTCSQRECNYMIKEICREAGLTRQIKRRHAGRDIIEELCESIHFHIGRKSYCTNSLKRGSSITDVMQFMGHTNPKQTMGYNCSGPTFSADAIANQRKSNI